MRVAAIADLHACHRHPERLAARLEGVETQADVLLCGGDLTESSDPREARALVAALRGTKIPIVCVFGNHDHEGGALDEVRAILEAARWTVLDGDAVRLGDLGVAGGKGFCGGFGKRRLTAFGEPAIKRFVGEATDELLRLERAARLLDTPQRVLLTHYAPITATLIGESPEIFPFLGNSELAAVGDDAGVDVHIHGHAHFGRVEGRTSGGVRVLNVALPVLDAHHPPLPYKVIELPGSVGAVAPLR